MVRSTYLRTPANCSSLLRALFRKAYEAMHGESVARNGTGVLVSINTTIIVPNKAQEFSPKIAPEESSGATLTRMNISISAESELLFFRNCRITTVGLLRKPAPFRR